MRSNIAEWYLGAVGKAVNTEVIVVIINVSICCKSIVCRFIYETEQFNGIGELLEILGRSASTVTLSRPLEYLYRQRKQKLYHLRY